MFKYISEILSKFNQRQRIIALVTLLISIIIISIGPKITESLTYNDEELRLRIESQNNQIGELNKRIDELNLQVISNQRECTNEIVVWPVIAGLLVVIVQHLLSKYRQKHADTSAHHNGHN